MKDVKVRLAERLGGVTDPGHLRIIFAGRELGDEVSVDSCDLGNQSVLHAVEAGIDILLKQALRSSCELLRRKDSKRFRNLP